MFHLRINLCRLEINAKNAEEDIRSRLDLLTITQQERAMAEAQLATKSELEDQLKTVNHKLEERSHQVEVLQRKTEELTDQVEHGINSTIRYII